MFDTINLKGNWLQVKHWVIKTPVYQFNLEVIYWKQSDQETRGVPTRDRLIKTRTHAHAKTKTVKEKVRHPSFSLTESSNVTKYLQY